MRYTSHLPYSLSAYKIYSHFLTLPSPPHSTLPHLQSSTHQFNPTTPNSPCFTIPYYLTTSLPITYNHINSPHSLYFIYNTYPSSQPTLQLSLTYSFSSFIHPYLYNFTLSISNSPASLFRFTILQITSSFLQHLSSPRDTTPKQPLHKLL